MFSGNLGSDIPIELIQELEKRDPGANVLEFLKVSKAGNLEGITLKAVELTRDFVKANSAKILGLLGWSLEEEAVLARAAEATAMAFVMSTLAYSVTPSTSILQRSSANTAMRSRAMSERVEILAKNTITPWTAPFP